MDAQASQGSFHLPSSMEDFSPSSTMDEGLEQNQTFLNSVLVGVGGMYEEGEGEVGE